MIYRLSRAAQGTAYLVPFPASNQFVYKAVITLAGSAVIVKPFFGIFLQSYCGMN
jgi:hypothetical protein